MSEDQATADVDRRREARVRQKGIEQRMTPGLYRRGNIFSLKYYVNGRANP